MAKKNKRYVLYTLSGYCCRDLFGFTQTKFYSVVTRRRYSRRDIITRIATYLTTEPDLMKRTSIDLSKHNGRMGISISDLWKESHCEAARWCTYLSIKVIKGEEEVPANLKTIFAEAEDKAEELKARKHYIRHWKGSPKSWKTQYKCRKQWEIHKSQHAYVDKTAVKSYDLSWEA